MDKNDPHSGKEEEGELKNLRRLLAEYETRLTQAADLAARVRHEINNPLTGLLGQAQLLQREELSDGARRRVGTIEHLAMRIRDTAAELRGVEGLCRAGESAAVVGEGEANREGFSSSEPPRH